MMKLRLAHPEYLVDINDLADLSFIDVGRDEVRIGALTRHRDLLDSEALATVCPIFHDAERVIADPPVRNRGSLGGSLCQADPSEDLSSVCAALAAVCVIRGPGGERRVPMADFHRGPYETALEQSEMLLEVRIPLYPASGSAYAKVDRRAGDWAVVGAGAAVRLDGGVDQPRVLEARVGLTAVGPNTTLIPAVAEALRGRQLDDDALAEAGALAAANCSPRTDPRGSEAYKRHLADELTRRTLRTAADRARAASRGERV
jgi:carbon-monoxide dehydrogenase medium subunit